MPSRARFLTSTRRRPTPRKVGAEPGRLHCRLGCAKKPAWGRSVGRCSGHAASALASWSAGVEKTTSGIFAAPPDLTPCAAVQGQGGRPGELGHRDRVVEPLGTGRRGHCARGGFGRGHGGVGVRVCARTCVLVCVCSGQHAGTQTRESLCVSFGDRFRNGVQDPTRGRTDLNVVETASPSPDSETTSICPCRPQFG